MASLPRKVYAMDAAPGANLLILFFNPLRLCLRAAGPGGRNSLPRPLVPGGIAESLLRARPDLAGDGVQARIHGHEETRPLAERPRHPAAFGDELVLMAPDPD